VPTKYGGTDLFLSEFDGWPVHLLGGSPNRQLNLAYYLEVVSADGNAATRAAEFGTVFNAGRTSGTKGLSRRAMTCRTALLRAPAKRSGWPGKILVPVDRR
jgi:hypothetical protein